MQPQNGTWSRPRSIKTIQGSTSDLLVLERGTSSIVHFLDTNGDGVPETRATLVQLSGLNHGLVVDYNNQFIYASSSSNVYRWPFNRNNATIELSTTDPTIVISNMNDNGNNGYSVGHSTRTLIFDNQSRLYVSVGSVGNVDADSFRSRIRRFSNVDDESQFPIDFTTGEVFADGLRNEVGLTFDQYNVLWGVENGADNLRRSDLGNDIYNDNPAERLHRFPESSAGSHYGYPYCWTEFRLPENVAQGRGSQWAWPSNSFDFSDEQCRNLYRTPDLAMQAHSAPLGITFYEWQPDSELPPGCSGAFPQAMDGYAFIAFHGSWNRAIPTGYKVIFVPMTNGQVSGDAVDLLAHDPPNAQWEDGFRPVDVAFDGCGRLLVSGDGRGSGSKLVRPEYSGSSPDGGPTDTLFTAFPTQAPTPTSICVQPLVPWFPFGPLLYTLLLAYNLL